MISGNVVILLFMVESIQMFDNPDRNCDFLVRVPYRQMITVSNSEWPSRYIPNLNCRWVFDCPSGYACRLRCRDVGLPKTSGCFLDRIMVSTSGDLQLTDAHLYCGGKKVNARSVGSRMVMGFVSSDATPGGRFRCKVRPEPWVSQKKRWADDGKHNSFYN